VIRRLARECLVCGFPLDGLLGRLSRLFGIRRSARNPNVCSRCNVHVEEGRLVEMTVLFADLSSFTELTGRLGAEGVHRVVDGFLELASDALVKHHAAIDKYLGDGVMALFNAPIRLEGHGAQAVAAAREILAGMPRLGERFGLTLGAAVGIASGFARVGRVGSRDRKDYTAIGSAVNLAARLEATARSGEIVIDQGVYREVAAELPDLRAESLSLKGFPEPIEAYRFGDASGGPGFIPAPALLRARTRGMRLGGLALAVLGAPCASVVFLGPLAAFLGIGAVFASAASWAGPFLDARPVRLPLMSLAAVAAAVNLLAVRHSRSLRREADAKGLASIPSPAERRRSALVLTLAVVTVLVLILEVYSHQRLHGVWF
jgi:adenylate cyclase